MIRTEVDIVCAAWSALGIDWQSRAESATGAALAEAGRHDLLDAPAAEIAVRLTDDLEMRQLNACYRGQDKPTNVLSFPGAAGAGARLPDPAIPAALGDIALGFETVEAEARAQGKRLADHATHLLVHGVLHLLGHDHEAEADAQIMEQLERQALARLAISDPYAETGAGREAEA